MALAFSRAVEEMIATRILLTATDGYVDITALGQGGGGGVVSVNARTVRLASENSFLNLGCSTGGDGRITLRAGGDGSAILLTTPKTGKTALLSVCPEGVQLVYGNSSNPGTVRLLDEGLELSMGQDGGQVTVTDDSVVLRVGKTSLRLTAQGIVSQYGEATCQIIGGENLPTQVHTSNDGRA